MIRRLALTVALVSLTGCAGVHYLTRTEISPYRRAVPEVTAAPDAALDLTVTPASYASWSAMFSANPTKKRFLLTAGDYTPWGVMVIDAATGDGTALQRRVVMFADPTLPPWQRIGNEALVARFDIGSGSPSSARYWILHGLTIRGAVSENTIQFGSSGNIVDSMLIENGSAVYGIRIRIGAEGNTVQRSVFRNPVGALKGDSIGIQLRVVLWSGDDRVMNNRIVDCDFINYGDGIQTTVNTAGDGIGFDGTIIDGIEAYTTPDYYSDGNGNDDPDGSFGYTENALDFKGGSNDPLNPVIVSNVRAHGYRYSDTAGGSTGSDGVAITIHIDAQYIVFEDVVIWDCPGGIRTLQWTTGNINRTRNITYRRVWFIEIEPKGAPLDTGYALKSTIPDTFEDIVAVRSTTLQDSPGVQVGDNTWSGSRVIDTPLGLAATAWAAGVDNSEAVERRAGSVAILSKRLTGVETVRFANADPFLTPFKNPGGVTVTPVNPRVNVQ